MHRVCLALGLVLTLPAVAQDPADALLDLLVFGIDAGVAADAYPVPIAAALDAYRRRAAAYQSGKPESPARDLNMARQAFDRYERRLVAITNDSEAARLAAEYVSALRPCYEWEGGHDCPEKEAVFADDYQAKHPNGPFRNYLPLLAAHRWLCAADAYDQELRPADASRSRSLAEARLTTARQSADPLVRAAAQTLASRSRCLR